MAASSPNISDFELKVEFRGDYVVHTVHNQEEIWSRGQIIGRGSFGKVFLQKRKGGEQLRAVKEVALAPLGEGGTHQELLAFINTKDYDRYFVKFLGWYKNSYDIFFVMEYLKDGDLALYMQDRPRAKENAKQITKQILQGLEVLHEKKICHRDLKPQNILIASTTKIWVKIADFGVAKQTAHSTAKSGWGTDNYRAPEAFNGVLRNRRKLRGLSYALDMWSLGSMLHELLTSQTPFLEPDLNLTDDELESGLAQFTSPQRMLDMRMFVDYCSGNIKFPTQVLQDSQVSKEGTDFIKILLAARPEERPTATSALQNLWLKEYTNNIPLKSTAEEAKSFRASLLKFKQSLSISASPLLKAVEAMNADEVTIILNSRVNISSSNCEGCFLLAVKLGALDIVKLFLGKKINLETLLGRSTALQTAAEGGHIDIVKLLLDKGAMVNAEPAYESGRTALQAAAGGGHIDIVKLLLHKGAMVNAEPARYNGRTALQAAAVGGHIDIVKLLLDKGATVNAKVVWHSGRTALQAAAGGGHIDIVKLLLDKGATVNAKVAYDIGRTALQAAAEGRHINIVNLLLTNGADIHAPTILFGGVTALEAGRMSGSRELIRILETAGRASLA